MSNGVFADRMREAAVVLRSEELEAFRSAVGELATAKLKRDLLLGLVRLAYGREVESTLRDSFLDQLTRRDVSISARSHQLTRVLAALVLIERFMRSPARRAPKNLVPDSLAAIAVLVLDDQGEPSVHPDLASHAGYWTQMVSDHLRRGGPIKAPPLLPPTLAALAEESSSTDETSSKAGSEATQLLEVREYVASLEDWLRHASAVGRIAAVEEQQAIAWWLLSTSAEEDHVAAVSKACNELVALVRFLPGPPASDQLLIRRLGAAARAAIDVQELADFSSRSVPEGIRDLVLLLNGVSNHPERTAPAGAVARWLYNELQLAEMVDSKGAQ